MSSTTTANGHFSTNFLGHVQTEQELVKNFEKLDQIVEDLDLAPEPGEPSIEIPAFAAEDINKVLGVVDDGEGNPVLGWVELPA